MPIVSIIIPVYNTERFLCHCMDSVINQTLRNTEIICVNDGSSDGSPAILKKYAMNDTRIRVISKDNVGLGAASARNLGYKHANGKYVMFLDSDDFFELDMLEHMVCRAEETDADIVVGNGKEYDDISGRTNKAFHILDSKLLPDKKVFSHKDCPDSIFQITQGQAWNKLFNKSFLEKYDLRFQDIKYTDDAYFTYSHMALARQISVVDKILFYYRVNTGTSQSDGITNYPDSAYLPYTSLKKSLEVWGIYDEVRKSFINCAAAFMRHCIDKVTTFKVYKYLHEKYQAELFPELEINVLPEQWAYDKRLLLWVNQVATSSAEDLLFNCTQLFNKGMTTAAMRFRLPKEKIKIASNLVLVGAGLIGRYYYSQIILSDRCRVVMWCDDDNDSGRLDLHPMSSIVKVQYDYVFLALASEQRMAEAKQQLLELGVPEAKIIYE